MRGTRSHITPAWKAKVRALIMRDVPAKTVGLAFDMGDSAASRWIHALGFRRMFVTDEERKHLLARRHPVTQQQQQQKAA